MAAELSLYELLQHVRLYRLVSGQEARVTCYCASKLSCVELYSARQHNASI